MEIQKLDRLYVVAGAPGSGKSTFARLLAQTHRKLISPIAKLDMDTMYSEYDEAFLEAIGLSDSAREDPRSEEQKQLAYRGTKRTALENRESAPVIMVAPFTGPVHSEELWRDLVEEVGGPQAQLIWMQTDPEAVWRNLNERGLERDGDKIGESGDFPAFLDRVQLDSPPPFAHHTVENYFETTKEALEQRAVQILVELGAYDK